MNKSKLNPDSKKTLIYKFCQALAEINNASQAAEFLAAVLTLREAEMLALRMEIITLLINGFKQNDIREITKTSPNTIARASISLKKLSSETITILQKVGKLRQLHDKPQIAGQYIWGPAATVYLTDPISEILATYQNIKDSREKKRFLKAIEKLEQKQADFKEIDEIYAYFYRQQTQEKKQKQALPSKSKRK